MYIRALALLTIATALSGCFGSDDEIWPVKGGMNLGIPDGEYDCTYFQTGRPIDYRATVKLVTEGNNFYYRTSGDQVMPTTLSFYKITEDLYIISAQEDGDDKFQYQFARVVGKRIVRINESKEEANAAADSLGVKLEHDHLLNTGTIDERRAFIIGVGENLSNASVVEDCKPASI